MLKVAFCIYRQWGYAIYTNIRKYQVVRGDFEITSLITCPDKQFTINKQDVSGVTVTTIDPEDNSALAQALKASGASIVVFFSWSWLVKAPIFDDYICLVLHPSPVPIGRGGTPIQNQILSGINDTYVSLFRMSAGLDSGPVYAKTALSLEGTIEDIFNRMIDLGSTMCKRLISDAINNDLQFVPQQNVYKHPPYKRRRPEDSEIKLNNLKNMRFNDLNNLVRSLRDPYPNAYIMTQHGTIYLQSVERYPKLPANGKVLNNRTRISKNNNQLYFLRLQDGLARLVEFKV